MMYKKYFNILKNPPQIQVEAYHVDIGSHLIGALVLEADFLQKKASTNDQYNTDLMAAVSYCIESTELSKP